MFLGRTFQCAIADVEGLLEIQYGGYKPELVIISRLMKTQRNKANQPFLRDSALSMCVYGYAWVCEWVSEWVRLS